MISNSECSRNRLLAAPIVRAHSAPPDFLVGSGEVTLGQERDTKRRKWREERRKEKEGRKRDKVPYW